jgi:hypothetical protein
MRRGSLLLPRWRHGTTFVASQFTYGVTGRGITFVTPGRLGGVGARHGARSPHRMRRSSAAATSALSSSMQGRPRAW